MTTGGDRRMLRVNELVREHLVEILRRDVSNPELANVVITSVDVSKDLSVAHVLVRLLITQDDEKARKNVLLHLKKAAPRVRRALATRDPGLVEALEALVAPATRGDPMSALRWTSKSTPQLAAELTAQRHPVSARTVARLLKDLNYSLQGLCKTRD